MIAFLNSLPGACAQGIIWGIMAIGVYITFRILDIADLSVDGSFATGGAVLVMSMMGGMSLPLAMILAFVAGCLAGLATGIFHTKFGIPAILAGILTQLSLYSINLRILGGKANQALSANNFNLIVSLRNVPKSLVVGGIFTVFIIAILYWFFGTETGHSLRATGCNPDMARANGISTDKSKILALVISNGIVSLSGALLSQYQGFADINMGRGAIVIGLAAVIIGDVIFNRIFHNFALKLLACIFGGVLYYIVLTIVLRLGFDANDLKLFSALVVAIFMAVPFWKKKITASVKAAANDKNFSVDKEDKNA